MSLKSASLAVVFLHSVIIFDAAICSDMTESFLSSQSHKPFESEKCQSHLKFYRVRGESWLGRVESESNHKNCRVTSSHWFASSSQCRVTRNFTFFLRPFLLWNGAQHAIKWYPTCYKMAADKLESGAQCCFTRLIKGYLYLSFLSLYFTCLFHTQSFQKVLPNLATSVAPLRLRCVECASHHEQYVREEQHPYICGANKQK